MVYVPVEVSIALFVTLITVTGFAAASARTTNVAI
ncbi:hypothetical protein SAMN05518871_10131 [Psychrobacillus sp. OK028]|nr:hypothetical protein SAMN05518871_10131 [Psychrobacillus sp. OK028]